VTISYTAGDEDDEETIHLAIKEAIETELPELFTVENLEADGLKIHVTDGFSTFAVELNDEKLEIVLLGAYAVYLAQQTGPIYAPIGTLTMPVSNTSGVDSLFNYATGLTGRIVESDTELRNNLGTREKQASSNEIAIKNAIEAVPGVEYAEVYSNRTMLPHNGRPAKSYEAVVSGGDERTIAQTIFDNGPAGIEAFGNTVITIHDDEGNPWPVGFSRPLNQYIWIKIAIRKNLEEQYPINGNDLIKDNVFKWATANAKVGVDFIRQRVGIPLHTVPGIAEHKITLARTTNLTPPDPSAYVSANIEIGEIEIAVFDRGRIFVEEMAVE
jgi:copper chaperone CopZ